tara:strand:- start:430 stop:606 length:177 start_codon:yes stop_codon:yes gene_type:complete
MKQVNITIPQKMIAVNGRRRSRIRSVSEPINVMRQSSGERINPGKNKAKEGLKSNGNP